MAATLEFKKEATESSGPCRLFPEMIERASRHCDWLGIDRVDRQQDQAFFHLNELIRWRVDVEPLSSLLKHSRGESAGHREVRAPD